MRSKNAKAITSAESDHMARVKALPCSVCDMAGPSDAHHIAQGDHWTTVALCRDCHMGSRNGLHGQRAMWCRVRHCVNPAHLQPVTPLENLLRSNLTPAGMTHCKAGHLLEFNGHQRRCPTCFAEYKRRKAA